MMLSPQEQPQLPSLSSDSSLDNNFDSDFDERGPRKHIKHSASNMLSLRIDHVPRRYYTVHSTGHPSPVTLLSRPRHSRSSSLASTKSTVSLLRSTLLFAASQPQTPLCIRNTPHLASRTSLSSLESALSKPLSFSETSSVRSANISFASEPITAISPSTSPSLAQFSPTPRAISVLASFGVPSSMKPKPKSRSKTLPGWNARIVDYGSEDVERSGSPPSSKCIPTPISSDLPSISRAHAPPNLRSAVQPDPVLLISGGLKADWPDTLDETRTIIPGVSLAGTPRPSFPIDSESHAKVSPRPLQLSLCALEESQPPLSSNIKGKGRDISSPLVDSPLETSTHSRLAVPQLPCRRSNTTPTPNLRADGSILPSLAAIESSSRLMRAQISCASCKSVGPDYPRCPRCSEAWCSRECRLTASGGGKHKCQLVPTS